MRKKDLRRLGSACRAGQPCGAARARPRAGAFPAVVAPAAICPRCSLPIGSSETKKARRHRGNRLGAIHECGCQSSALRCNVAQNKKRLAGVRTVSGARGRRRGGADRRPPVQERASIPFRTGLATGMAIAAGPSRAALLGAPEQAQVGFLPANSPIAGDIQWLHNAILLPVTVGISLLVLVLLGYVVLRFNENAHPVPTRTTHNGPLEIAWTVLPALVLVVIAVPSFRLLTQQLVIPEPELTLKATASQWHWSYTYPKAAGGFPYNSIIKEDKDLGPATSASCRSTTRLTSRSARWSKLRRRLAGRHPLLLHPFVRGEDRRCSRPAQQGVVQGRAGGRLLRPVLQHLRHRPCVHADRVPCREPAGLRRLAGEGQKSLRLGRRRRSRRRARRARAPP